MMNIKTRVAVLAGATAIVAGSLLAGAAATAASSSDPWQPEFDKAAGQATSDLELRVLADSEISSAEYRTAYDAYAACLTSSGWSARPVEMRDALGLEIAGKAEGPDFEKVNSACRNGTVEIIEPLYLGRLFNPERANYVDVLEECLRATGEVAKDFELDDLANGSVELTQVATDACVGRAPGK